MKNKKIIITVLIGCALLSSLSFAQIPNPLKEIKISGSVKLDNTTGIYTYEYSVFNPPVNKGKISRLEIDVAKPENSKELNSADIVFLVGINAQGKLLTSVLSLK